MYLGNQPALSYTSFAKQDFTTSATTSYVLSQPVSNANEIALFINFVRQEPTTAYTASGTTLTLTSATSASDDMYCIFLGKALQTVNPPAGSVGISQLSATGTPSSSTFLRGDNTWQSAGGTNTPAFYVYKSNGITFFTINTWTKVILDTEVYDTNNNFDSTTNYRFTPTVAGKYIFSGAVFIDYNTSSGSTLYSGIYKNGTQIGSNGHNGGTGYGTRNVISPVVEMNGSTDYVELYCYYSGTDPYYNGGVEHTFFSGFKIIE